MTIDVLSAAKRVYYKVRPQKLAASTTLDIGYVLHTERVYDEALFERLLTFCRDFGRAHGDRPICTVMSANNPRVEGGLRRHRLTESDYARRVERLASVATIGYHGHFWADADTYRANERAQIADVFHSEELDIRGTNFVLEPVRQQMEEDLAWFQGAGIDHHGLYAAGWWFLHPELLRLLAARGFRHDFSFSRSPWFRNEHSVKLMRENRIRTGEAFEIGIDGHTIVCVQNLIGCHTTDHPEDFTRNLNRILDPDFRAVLGVVNAHDYDVSPAQTLRCLAYVKRELRGRVWGGDALLRGELPLPRPMRRVEIP